MNVGNSLQERNGQTSCRVVSVFCGYRRGSCRLFYTQRYPTTYDSEMGFGTTLFFFVYAAGVRVGELVSAMRFFYFLFVFLFWNDCLFAQEIQRDSIRVGNNDPTSILTTNSDSIATSVVNSISDIDAENSVKIHGEVFAKSANRYKIYPTSNMYNFLKLDTKMGYIYRIQWSYEDNKRYETDVNYKRLVDYEDDWVNDRFEIYPTSNIYSFLLLDKINGRVWHCYWGFESEGNGIQRIY